MDILGLDRTAMLALRDKAMRVVKALIAALIWCGIPICADDTSARAADFAGREVSVGPYDQVFAHVVDGGTWKTTFVLTNLTGTATPYLLGFFGNDGRPLTLPIVGIGNTAAVSGTIAPYGTLILETAGSSEDLKQGSAIFFCLDRPATDPAAKPVGTTVGGAAIFRQRVPGRPDFEAVVPVSSLEDSKLTFPFDNSGGFVTGVALVNASTNLGSALVFLRDEDGKIIGQDLILLGSRNKSVFVVPEKYPQTAGKRGSIEVVASTAGLGGLGLRFNPNGSFTSMHPSTLRSSSVSVPDGGRECYPAIESRIDGSFDGWTGDTIFKLWNGQVWQQAQYGFRYRYSFSPRVIIYPTLTGCKMVVEGLDLDEGILVKRIR